jgi:broad specificity phosphatase PhoE
MSSDCLTLVVVRHARTALTGIRLNGCGPHAADPNLDDHGRLQARALKAALAGELTQGFGVLCSPTNRAQQTATAWGIECAIEPRLSEVDFGDWEGLDPAEVARHWPRETARWWSDPDYAPPGGSSLTHRAEQWDQMVQLLWTSSASPPGWILVGHSATVRIAAARALGVDVAAMSRMSIPTAVMLRIRLWSDGGSCLDGLTRVEAPMASSERMSVGHSFEPFTDVRLATRALDAEY